MSTADNVISKSSPMARQTFYRLVIDCSGEPSAEAHSLNKALAEELLKLRPRQRSLQMEKCLLNVLEDKDAEHADLQTEQKGLAQDLIGVIGVLNEREQQVIRSVYGVDGVPLTMAEVGQQMGLTRERVRQIRDKALRKLNRAGKQLKE